jgi:GntR family transcriptional regulator
VNIFLKLTSAHGEPLYIQLIQRIRHAVESGNLRDGDQLPSIRALAGELVVSPNTVVKAYSELEHEGLIEMRQGAGAFVTARRRGTYMLERNERARGRVDALIEELRREGLADGEIRRLFEMELLATAPANRR